jgi:catechol 2,3-dioxygenase-like lactoylglutathione lyase family enzyme
LIARLSAQLFVADIQASCDFFTRKLGFTVAFIHGDPPFYGQVVRGAARLDLRSVWEPVFVGDIREREHLLSASMSVATSAELDRLFKEFTATGASFHQVLRSEPWGARTFIVRDPDGNLLLFGGPGES